MDCAISLLSEEMGNLASFYPLVLDENIRCNLRRDCVGVLHHSRRMTAMNSQSERRLYQIGQLPDLFQLSAPQIDWLVSTGQLRTIRICAEVRFDSNEVSELIYGHLIPGANVSFVDRLDQKPSKKTSRKPQQSATPAQPREALATEVPAHVIDFIGSGGQS